MNKIIFVEVLFSRLILMNFKFNSLLFYSNLLTVKFSVIIVHQYWARATAILYKVRFSEHILGKRRLCWFICQLIKLKFTNTEKYFIKDLFLMLLWSHTLLYSKVKQGNVTPSFHKRVIKS